MNDDELDFENSKLAQEGNSDAKLIVPDEDSQEERREERDPEEPEDSGGASGAGEQG